jgi:predicted ArsR family transcriptional regulator
MMCLVVEKKWLRVLGAVGKSRVGTTAADVVKILKITHVSAIQTLRILRTWGHVRLVGFKASGGGRPAHVFVITNHGKKALVFHAGKRRRDDKGV